MQYCSKIEHRFNYTAFVEQEMRDLEDLRQKKRYFYQELGSSNDCLKPVKHHTMFSRK